MEVPFEVKFWFWILCLLLVYAILHGILQGNENLNIIFGVSILFLIVSYIFWSLISWILGGELIPAPSTGAADGGYGGGRRYYYRRRVLRIQDIRPKVLIFMFLFASLFGLIIAAIVWLAGFGLNPVDSIGLVLNVFGIMINILLIGQKHLIVSDEEILAAKIRAAAYRKR
jgi:hypothetical protein